MKRIFLFAFLIACARLATAQAVRSSVSAAYISVPTYSNQFKEAFSFRSNCASLAGAQHFSAGIFSERRFLVKELASYSLALALPTASGNFGFKADYFGEQVYNEATFGLTYARKLGEKIDVGVAFDYFSMQTAGYGSASTVTFSAGTIVHLTDALQTGIQVYNPVGMKMGKTGDEKLPAIYSFGVGYDVSSQLYIGAEAVKTEDLPLSVNVGMQYAFADKLIARGGISSASSVYFIGFGIKIKNLRIDATASLHPYLGTSPGLLLLYSPKP